MRDPVNPSSDGGEPGSSGRIPFSQQQWSLDTIKVHFDSRIDADRRYFSDLLSIQEQTNRDRFTSAEKAVYAALAANKDQVSAAMAASKEAINKAEAAAEARFAALNELRKAMIDQQQNFAGRSETERRLKMLEDANIAASSKTIGANQLFAAAAAIIVTVGVIIAIIFQLGGEG